MRQSMPSTVALQLLKCALGHPIFQMPSGSLYDIQVLKSCVVHLATELAAVCMKIRNYRVLARPGLGPVLLPHMALAIEPVVVAQRRGVYKRADGWTECTVDGSLAAHFEDTILLGAEGPEILTR